MTRRLTAITVAFAVLGAASLADAATRATAAPVAVAKADHVIQLANVVAVAKRL